MAIIVGTNSYITISECNDIMAGFLNTTEWDNATDTVKEKALRQACSMMNTLNYIGTKTDSTQKLEFPRLFVSQGGGLKDVGVPDDIKTGQAQMALCLLKPNMANKVGIKSESVDGVGSVTYEKAITEDVIFKPAYDFIGLWIEKAVALT